MSLDIVLPANKIPHKITHVHVTNLISKKEPQIFTKRWFYQCFCFSAIANANRGSFNISPFLVCLDMVGIGAVHTWKKCFKLWIIFCTTRKRPCNFVFTIYLIILIFFVDICDCRGIIIGSVKQRTIAILFAV